MIDSERFKLLYGPYQVPKCKLGDKLLCEYRDREVTVKGMTDGPHPMALRIQGQTPRSNRVRRFGSSYPN